MTAAGLGLLQMLIAPSTVVFDIVADGWQPSTVTLGALGLLAPIVSGSLACRPWRTKTPHVLVSLLVGCSPWGRGLAYCTLFAPGLLVG